jgi:AraC-like DNA-binding protein
MLHKKQGFDGQRAIVIPPAIIKDLCQKNTLIKGLYFTDIGYYPKAKFHYRNREQGIKQHILIYCIEGEGKVRIADDNFNISTGDYIIIPANKPHAYEANINNPWTIYWCHFNGDQAEKLLIDLSKENRTYENNVVFSDERINLFNRMYQLLEKGYSLENLSFVNMIFPFFMASFLFKDKFNSNYIQNKDLLIEQSIEFMQHNFDKTLSLADFAAQLNFSISHYSTLFKNKTGYAPIAYFNQIKMQKASQFLHFTALRTKEIAFKVGINDAYYFSRLFTKTMGVSPKAYRQSRNPL